ncbi:MAG: acyl-CoA dehydrogenase family protein [Actinomycetota bacterium]|nr:acyl-CoA dehydrogenase family protein [Actinomycetota bacterium]
MYELNEEQKMLQQTVRQLAKDKVEPRAVEIDATQEYPWDMFELLRDNDLLALCFPEELDGAGADLLTVCLAIEELARVCVNTSLILGVCKLGSQPIMLAGNDEQLKKYIPPLARGDVQCAFGLTEPGAGSDAAAMSTKAVKKGDVYVINGQKCFITNGGIADTYSVFGLTDDSVGVKGISAFIVEKNFPGFEVAKIEHKMGIRGSRTAELVFTDMEVPAENLLGKEGEGFKIAMMTLDRTRPSIGAQAVGLAQGALDYAVSYAKERVQFGGPIGRLQGIQFMLADMAIQVEAARHLVYRSAAMMESAGREASAVSAMAKCFASDTAMKITVDAVQILGGVGYMTEYPLERMMRDAKITQIYEGTNQIQRVVIARHLLR